jgi:CBS domain containing-hemolysin-like protein/mannitol/fructose-specific phosphotransferase system IIA component (Ntr-type)
MDLILLGFALVFLLAFNAFFVLAEFAIVKVRSSRVAELVDAGNARAKSLLGIQKHIDEYLGVCQVGITLASIALGMVGGKATEVILGPTEHTFTRYLLAMGISYVVVSGSHILIGEQVPKSIAIRIADRIALAFVTPLRFFHALFFPALWLLKTVAVFILQLIGLPRSTEEEQHSEGELRIILDHFQERGMLSFRRLLFMENVFDLGGLVVSDAMRPRERVVCLRAKQLWPENLKVVRTARFTRYPLIDLDPERPVGFVHLKDVLIRDQDTPPDLKQLVRPFLKTTETTQLETLLAEMQRRRIHMALVKNREGQWTGLITLEDIIEEIIGTIRDEFEDEEAVRLTDALTIDRIHLGIEADSPIAAVKFALERMSGDSLPLPVSQIIRAVEDRERLVGTYLGHGIGMPHARLNGLSKPFLMIMRSEQGIPCKGTNEKAHLLFVLLTPAGQPRIHQRLQSLIATLLNESRYVQERLHTADSSAEVFDVIRTGEQASLD